MKFSTSLKFNHIFQRLYRSRGFADGLLVLYARRNRTETNRVGVTVGKKLGKAHIRNRIRRRVREVYRLNEDKFRTGWDIVWWCAARPWTPPLISSPRLTCPWRKRPVSCSDDLVLL